MGGTHWEKIIQVSRGLATKSFDTKSLNKALAFCCADDMHFLLQILFVTNTVSTLDISLYCTVPLGVLVVSSWQFLSCVAC